MGLGVTPTDQTAPAPESNSPYQIGNIKQVQSFKNVSGTNTDDSVVATTPNRLFTSGVVLSQGSLNVPPLNTSAGESFTLSVPVDIELSGNVRGEGTATLKADASLVLNDDGGINMKIDSVSIEDASGSVTISLMGGNVQESADIADFDLESKIAGAIESSLGTLETPLIPQIFAVDEAYNLGLGLGDITTVDSAAIRIPLTLSDAQDDDNATETTTNQTRNSGEICVTCPGGSQKTPSKYEGIQDQIRTRF